MRAGGSIRGVPPRDPKGGRLTAAAQAVILKAYQQNDSEIQKMGRAQAAAIQENLTREKAAAQEREEFMHRSIETLRSFAEVGVIAYEAITRGYERFKAFGEEVVKTTLIYNSLGASVEAAKERLDGTVATLDLISARNRGTELGLHLSSEQFAEVAQRAHEMAIAIGIETPEALNKMITGLALGKVKALDQAGVIIQVDKAHEDLAKRLGVTVDALSDTGKAFAVSTQAMEKIHELAPEAAKDLEKPLSVAEALEKTFVGVKNAWMEFIVLIGNTHIPDWMTKLIQRGAGKGSAAGGEGEGEDTSMFAADYFKSAGATTRAIPFMPWADTDKRNGMSMGPEEELGDRLDRDAMIKNKAKKTKLHEYTGIDRLLAARDQAEGNIKQLDRKDKAEALELNRLMDLGEPSMSAEASTKAADEAKAKINHMLQGIGDSFKTVEGDQVKKQGLISKLIYGDDEPEVVYDQMTQAEQRMYEMATGMQSILGETDKKFAGVLAHSLATWIGEGKGFEASMKQATHAMLMAMSEQAFAKGAYDEILALEMFFNGDPKSGGMAVTGAKFLALGAALGGAARLTNSGGGGGSSGAGQTPINTRPGATDTGPRNTTPVSGSSGPITIVLHVAPGGEGEAGRSMFKALGDYQRQTGQTLQQLLGGG